jgi:hypothetical protein
MGDFQLPALSYSSQSPDASLPEEVRAENRMMGYNEEEHQVG